MKANFAASAALTQFMVPDVSFLGFESYRCGTNCYPVNLENNLRIPEILNENLAQLQYKVIDVSSKFYNSRNKLLVMPVLGSYKAERANNLNVTSKFLNSSGVEVDADLFLPDDPALPNVWDGTDSSGNVCDLNNSVPITQLRNKWNDRIGQLQGYSTPVTTMGGSSPSPLILMTRAIKFQPIDAPLESLPTYYQKKIRQDFCTTKKIERTISTKKIFEEKEYYVPPNGSIFTMNDLSVTSVINLSDSFKKLLSYLILPVINPDDGPLGVSLQNYRVYTRELKIFEFSTDNPDVQIYTSRAARLKDYAARCAPGIAGNSTDEVGNLLRHLGEIGGGGFLSDLLGEAVKLIPI